MNNENQCIEYSVIWKVDAKTLETIEEKQLEAILASSCDTLDVTFKQLRLTKDTVSISVLSKDALNLSKVNNFLQKKVKIDYPRLTVTQFIGITRSGRPSKKDLRIQNILEKVDEIAYYDLDEVCEEEKAFKEYLGERPLTIIENGERLFLIDEEALSIPIYLNCFECTKIYRYGCCCGSPCDMSEKNKKVFKRHQKKIEEAMKGLSQTDYERMIEKGGFITRDGSINAYEGRCAMLVEHEGVYKCMPHKYALDNDIPIYDLCPLSCLMYPLEIIEFIVGYKTEAIFLTSAVEEGFAETFSRWGSYKKLEVDLRCLNQKAHNEQFKEENYKPVYKVNEGLLSHEFSKAFYRAIEHLLG